MMVKQKKFVNCLNFRDEGTKKFELRKERDFSLSSPIILSISLTSFARLKTSQLEK